MTRSLVVCITLAALGCDGPPMTPGRASDREHFRQACEKWLASDAGTWETAAACDGCFERGAASCVLSSPSPAKCRDMDGPRGSFHVKTTFSPDGSVSNAVFDHDEAVGQTPLGRCMREQFLQLRIPPFRGTAVSVGKMVPFQ